MSGLLLDSQVLLWALAQPQRLSPTARSVIEDERSTLHFSLASVWEIAIKQSIGKLDLADDWLEQIQSRLGDWGVRWLAIMPKHCRAVAALPFHHKDQFDRMLIAQAMTERLLLVSSDSVIDAYGIERVW